MGATLLMLPSGVNLLAGWHTLKGDVTIAHNFVFTTPIMHHLDSVSSLY